MKILYLGHIYEHSGWGNGCRDYLRCLISTGIEVVARPIVLTGGFQGLPEDIRQAEQNSLSNCDVCIQQVLPHYYTYNSNFRNIGIPYLETFNLQYTSWYNKMKLMDELWVPNVQCSSHLFGEFKSYYVAQPVDFDKFKRKVPELHHASIDCNFNFYFIGDFTVRKRISSIIKCYYLAFQYEPVNLVLKCTKFNTSPDNLYNQIRELCHKIQDSLKLYPNRALYPEVTILTEQFTDDQILSLHKAANCFVTASYGESVCLPALDSVCLGNQAIGSDVGGLADIVDNPIDGVLEPCNGMQESFSDLYTGRELWFNVDQLQLIDAMRDVYEDRKLPKKSRRKELEGKHNYTSVGNRMKQLLNKEIKNDD